MEYTNSALFDESLSVAFTSTINVPMGTPLKIKYSSIGKYLTKSKYFTKVKLQIKGYRLAKLTFFILDSCISSELFSLEVQ
jgi:hypothetical protein